MRVIAGKAKSLPLKTTEGANTRPTTDRIKETLFNILGPAIPGCRFLDLFSGSGAIGIEALSRGAEEAVFVEHDKKAAVCLRENLAFTRLADRAVILETDVLSALERLTREGTCFDLIFLDPPYGKLWEKKVLEALSKSGLLASEGRIVVEASLETDMDYAADMGFEIVRIKNYKTNRHIFLEKMPD
ncbi:MAG: 16S rRNA (guanine(966)-N(2))-methyltransferase RsmD [Lachnospiraceae bacterium]|nr:16S rRNA (guanine(966)-N(2))-methyltransferase RsmD [Lachnospiraceae bacterium]